MLARYVRFLSPRPLRRPEHSPVPCPSQSRTVEACHRRSHTSHNAATVSGPLSKPLSTRGLQHHKEQTTATGRLGPFAQLRGRQS